MRRAFATGKRIEQLKNQKKMKKVEKTSNVARNVASVAGHDVGRLTDLGAIFHETHKKCFHGVSMVFPWSRAPESM